jgi:hypothetical protein
MVGGESHTNGKIVLLNGGGREMLGGPIDKDTTRQGQRLNTTETKCSKIPTPQGEAKGIDTIGKRAKT